jgi:hypothetical protein
MGNLINALNGLKTNIFGGPSTSGTTTPILRQSAIEMKDNRPTSKAGVDPFAFSSISYPRDVTNDLQNGHYMLFYVNVQNRTKYRYKDPNGGDVGGNVSVTTLDKETGKLSTKTSKGGFDLKDKLKLSKLQGNYNNNADVAKLHRSKQKSQSGLSSVLPTTTRITDSVALYLPPSVIDSTSAGYSDSQTGMIGFAIAAGLTTSNEFKQGDYAGAAQALVDGFQGLLSEGVKKSLTNFAETLTETEGAAGLLNKTLGQADNPFMEVLFDKMSMRSFSYPFTFAPKNADEAADVQKIIALFRFHMAPEEQRAQARFLTLPSTFDIHYMYQSQTGQASENDFYNRIATCVLESCVVDYTPNGVQSFDDGSPTQIKMTLGFKETQLLTKSLVAAGY